MNGAGIYIGTLALGIMLFGEKSASFALNSFNPSDPYGTLARVAFGASVMASYPLIFFAMRNFFVRISTEKIPILGSVNKVSAILLLFISYLASNFKDIGIVGSISGGIFGTSMMFIFPPLMYIRALQRKAKDENTKAPKLIIGIHILLLIIGSLFGIFGTASSIIASVKH